MGNSVRPTGDASDAAGSAEFVVPVDARFNRELIVTAVGPGVDAPAVQLLVEQLADHQQVLDSLIEAALGDPQRMAAVRATGLLNGAQPRTYSRIAALTAEALGAPFATVAVFDRDRQVIVGTNVTDPRFEWTRTLETSVSKFVAVAGLPFIVDDVRTHPLLKPHPAVQSGEVGAYAGVPLIAPGGFTVGVLCAWDVRPHTWTGPQVQLLQDFGDIACKKIFSMAE
jgi:GAF domain-containing protein